MANEIKTVQFKNKNTDENIYPVINMDSTVVDGSETKTLRNVIDPSNNDSGLQFDNSGRVEFNNDIICNASIGTNELRVFGIAYVGEKISAINAEFDGIVKFNGNYGVYFNTSAYFNAGAYFKGEDNVEYTLQTIIPKIIVRLDALEKK